MKWYDTLKAAISSGWGFVTGAGSIAGAVKAGAELADDITKEIHDHSQQTAGENRVIAKDNDDAAKSNAAVAAAAVANSDAAALDQLCDGRA